MFSIRWFLLLPALWVSTAMAESVDTNKLYLEHCSACHGMDRLGGIGPALLPQNLKRLRQKKAVQVIARGRPATQMAGFEEKLTGEQIAALAEMIYEPLAEIPPWGMEQIAGSRLLPNPLSTLGDKPVFSVKDLLNLFIVVETGDHHATLLDGDTFEPVHRFKTRFALHGGPKYGPNGRFVYFGSRDGWITKYDIYNLKVVAEVRAGINMRNIAVSADGRYIIAANYLPHTLAIFDAAELKPIRIIEAKGLGITSRVSGVYTAKPRESFVAAMKDLKEVWEISYADDPPPGFSGWEHSYDEEAGDLTHPGAFPVKRIDTPTYFDDFFFNQEYDLIFGAARGEDGVRKGMVLSLDVKRVIDELDLPGMPHLGSGISWKMGDRTVMATPNLKEAVVSVIDMDSFETVKRIETLGTGFFMRSHENSPYAWVDVFFGPHKDKVHIIDKQRLEIVETLQPIPGKTAAHVEFTRDGRHALLSIWENDGALIVYDAETLKEVKRIPMSKPSGKYNVWNKTRLSEGTSH